jgi:phosphoribosylformylglycinamidine synthase
MKFGVIVFPGSNCDHDTYHVIAEIAKQPVTFLWHESHDLENCDAILVPGGFAYGDYLRTGAIARFAPVMESVRKFAADGGLVLGICNGFQILCESGLLPGALLRNAKLKYVCKPIELKIENRKTRFTSAYGNQQTVWMTQGNGDGNFFADADTLKAIEDNDQVVFRYVENPNGSVNDIAGIVNKAGNVLGMMPHPDRAFEPALGSADGAPMFHSLVAALQVA